MVYPSPRFKQYTNPPPCGGLQFYLEVSPPPPRWRRSKPFPTPQHHFGFPSSRPPAGAAGCPRGCEVISVHGEEKTQRVPGGHSSAPGQPDPAGTSWPGNAAGHSRRCQPFPTRLGNSHPLGIFKGRASKMTSPISIHHLLVGFAQPWRTGGGHRADPRPGQFGVTPLLSAFTQPLAIPGSNDQPQAVVDRLNICFC